MKIGIGNDHAAVELKNIISEHLKERGCEVVNFGTDTSESFDYPIAGYKVGKAVANGDVDLGILICGTGVGISLAANKVEGVRAVVCSEPFSAKLSRMHNNTNVLAFGARVVGSELAKMIVDEWLDAEFEGGRHERRVNLLNEIDHTRALKIVDEAYSRGPLGTHVRAGPCIDFGIKGRRGWSSAAPKPHANSFKESKLV